MNEYYLTDFKYKIAALAQLNVPVCGQWRNQGEIRPRPTSKREIGLLHGNILNFPLNRMFGAATGGAPHSRISGSATACSYPFSNSNII